MDCQEASEDCFLVTLAGNEYEVYLHAKKCSFGHYNDVLWSCPHLIVASREEGCDLIEFIDEKYKISNILMVYNVTIRTIAIDDIEADATLPPQIVSLRVWPKKVRIQSRSELETVDSPIVCSRCGAHEHNIRACERRERGDRVEHH